MVRNKLSAGVQPALTTHNHSPDKFSEHSNGQSKGQLPLSVFRTGNYTKFGASINTKNLDISSKLQSSPKKNLFDSKPVSINSTSPLKHTFSKFQNGMHVELNSQNAKKGEAKPVTASPHSSPGKDYHILSSHFISRIKAQPALYRKMFGVFKEGNEVLARWSDGLYYLGNVCKVDDLKHRCVVQFEDKSVSSVHFKDMQLLASKEDEEEDDDGSDDEVENNSDVTCVLCRDGNSDPPNEIVLCDKCGQGYHQLCHAPVIDTSVLHEEDVPWQCRTCVFAAVARRGGAESEGTAAAALKMMKQALPYDINSLTWWKAHKVNSEEIYCYCGGPGDWYLKMLQCNRCQQWFHEACIQCLETPILYGDRFYIFVCALCNHGNEYVKRLPMRWVDVVHLVLYNITITKTVKYYDFLSAIIPFFAQNWESLQLGDLVHEASTRNQLKERVLETLQNNKTRFQCGSESKKAKMSWGLRTRSPPVPPAVGVPNGVMINDDTFASVDLRHGSMLISDSPTPLKRNAPGDDEISFSKKKRRDTIEEWRSTKLLMRNLHGDNIFDSIEAPPKRKRGRPRKDQQALPKTSVGRGRGRRPIFGPIKLDRNQRRSSLSSETSSVLPLANLLQENNSPPPCNVPRTCSSIFERDVSDDELRRTVARCFSAEGRIACGERYKVLGKRVVPASGGPRVEYLIEWEGFTAKQLHESVHGR